MLTLGCLKESPKKSKTKSGGSRVVDPLEAVERSLADLKSKLKGEAPQLSYMFLSGQRKIFTES
ncbi:MAG: hypothetical protein ACTSVZ_03140 [Promethearchaeota archaeon]